MSGLALVASIVRLTLFEALRRRTLWALVILTAIIVILTGLGFQYLVTEAGTQPCHVVVAPDERDIGLLH